MTYNFNELSDNTPLYDLLIEPLTGHAQCIYRDAENLFHVKFRNNTSQTNINDIRSNFHLLGISCEAPEAHHFVINLNKRIRKQVLSQVEANDSYLAAQKITLDRYWWESFGEPILVPPVYYQDRADQVPVIVINLSKKSISKPNFYTLFNHEFKQLIIDALRESKAVNIVTDTHLEEIRAVLIQCGFDVAIINFFNILCSPFTDAREKIAKIYRRLYRGRANPAAEFSYYYIDENDLTAFRALLKGGDATVRATAHCRKIGEQSSTVFPFIPLLVGTIPADYSPIYSLSLDTFQLSNLWFKIVCVLSRLAPKRHYTDILSIAYPLQKARLLIELCGFLTNNSNLIILHDDNSEKRAGIEGKFIQLAPLRFSTATDAYLTHTQLSLYEYSRFACGMPLLLKNHEIRANLQDIVIWDFDKTIVSKQTDTAFTNLLTLDDLPLVNNENTWATVQQFLKGVYIYDAIAKMIVQFSLQKTTLQAIATRHGCYEVVRFVLEQILSTHYQGDALIKAVNAIPIVVHPLGIKYDNVGKNKMLWRILQLPGVNLKTLQKITFYDDTEENLTAFGNMKREFKLPAHIQLVPQHVRNGCINDNRVQSFLTMSARLDETTL